MLSPNQSDLLQSYCLNLKGDEKEVKEENPIWYAAKGNRHMCDIIVYSEKEGTGCEYRERAKSAGNSEKEPNWRPKKWPPK